MFKNNNMKNLVLYFVIISFLVSCKEDTPNGIKSKENQIKSVTLTKKQVQDFKLEFAYPKIEMIGLTIQANGKMEVPPTNKSFISVPFGGFIKSIRVLDGDIVKKGQELLTIEHPEIIQLQQDYLEIQASMELLHAEVERNEILVKNEAGSLKNLQSAKSNLNVSKAKLAGLKAKLEMADVNLTKLNKGEIQRVISITAPFDGVVTKVLANVGEFSPETNNLMEIIDLKHTHAEVYVFEKDAAYIRIGQKVKIKMIDPEQELNASVYLVGKEIGKDRTIKVHCHLDKESESLMPGAFFKATIMTNPTKLETISSEAIVKIDNKDAIFVQTNISKDKMEFMPYYVRVLKQDSGRTAFEYIDQKLGANYPIVCKETFEVLSTYLKFNNNDDE
jgi:cobalt-zinc-cadmium efflux system membrane fusion protein